MASLKSSDNGSYWPMTIFMSAQWWFSSEYSPTAKDWELKVKNFLEVETYF